MDTWSLDEKSFIKQVVLPRLIYIKYPGRTYKDGKLAPLLKCVEIITREDEYSNLKFNHHRVSFTLVYEDKTTKQFHMIVKIFPRIKNMSNLVPKYNMVLNEMMVAIAAPSIFGKFFRATYFVDNIFEFSEYPVIVTNNPLKEGYYYVTKRHYTEEELAMLAKFMADFHYTSFLMRGHPTYMALCHWIYEHPNHPSLQPLCCCKQISYAYTSKFSILLFNNCQENFYFRKKKLGDEGDVIVVDWYPVRIGIPAIDLLRIIPYCEDLAHYNNFVSTYLDYLGEMYKDFISDVENNRRELNYAFYEFLQSISKGIAAGIKLHLNERREEVQKKASKKSKKKKK